MIPPREYTVWSLSSEVGMARKKKTSVTLTPSLIDRIRAVAQRNKRSVSEEIEYTMERRVEEDEREQRKRAARNGE